jgi:hypothetical protein
MADDRISILEAKLARIESGEMKFADERSKAESIARTKLFIAEQQAAEKKMNKGAKQ